MAGFTGLSGGCRIAATLVILTASAATARAQMVPPNPPPAENLDDPAFEQRLPPLEETQASPTGEVETPLMAPPPPAPAADAELGAPLPPLATFDATPPARDIAEQGEKPTELRYRLVVTGLDGIGLAGRFRDLSVLRDDGPTAANAAQISARADEDVKLIETLLASEGYYDGTATSSIDAEADNPTQRIVTLTAVPGDRYRLGDIAIIGPPTRPEGLARQALTLKSGQPIIAAEVEAAEANIALRLPEQGYPFAEVGDRTILLNDDRTGDYSLPVTPGPRASFAGFRTEGDPVFDIDHVAVLARFDRGELYDSRRTDDLRQALIGTGLFSTVSVEPVRTGQSGPDGTEQVDMLVRQTRGPARRLAASAGYGTGEGIKLTGSWTHRNLFPPEGALIVDAIAGTQQQSLGATFRRSNAGQRDRTFQVGAAVSREDREAFSARSVNLSARLSRDSTPIWQKRWTYSVGAELIGTNESRFDPARGTRRRNDYLIGALPLQLGYDGSNSLLDPTRGFRVTLRTSPEASLQSGFYGYNRALLETSAYLPVSDSLVLAGRTRLGSIIGASRDRIAPSRRYYAGGGGSVRGFGYQELGPRDANNDPIGGRSLTEFALEARYRFGNFGVVPFIDAGQVYDNTLPQFSGLRYGVGIGGRYYTNFGPLRIDVATPLDRRRGEAKVALYISIGQAF